MKLEVTHCEYEVASTRKGFSKAQKKVAEAEGKALAANNALLQLTFTMPSSRVSDRSASDSCARSKFDGGIACSNNSSSSRSKGTNADQQVITVMSNYWEMSFT